VATGGAFDVFAVPAPNGTSLDPSGYVKGWAVEQGAAILEAHGLQHFAINAGGDVALRGAPLPDLTWRVGVRDPDDPSRVCAVVSPPGPGAVASSGSYERGAHVIDPSTGAPTADVASVTIVGPDLGLADAYATAVYVLGLEGLRWLDQQPGYHGLVVTHDGQLHATAGMRDLLRSDQAP
jgi:thiamine biosynthesis lipoprotein